MMKKPFLLAAVFVVALSLNSGAESEPPAGGEAIFGLTDAILTRDDSGAVVEVNLHMVMFQRGALAALRGQDRLERLILWDSDVTDDDLADLKGLGSLELLDLRRTGIGDAGLEHVMSLTGLEELVLDQTAITDGGLAGLKALTRLKFLDLASTRVTDEAMGYVRELRSLERLRLEGIALGNEGLRRLAGFATLKELDLWATRITDAGLANLTGLTNLEILDLRNCDITDEGLVILGEMTRRGELPALKMLHVDRTMVTPEGVTALRATWPGRHVEF